MKVTQKRLCRVMMNEYENALLNSNITGKCFSTKQLIGYFAKAILKELEATK